MDEKIKKLYEAAMRFDYGELYQSAEYEKAVKERLRVEALVEKLYGPAGVAVLEEYADAMYQIAEMECMHFFEQGYLAKK